MADAFDRDEHEGGGGFMMGLLTGTVLGAGLGMLLAPKRGTELRSQIGEQVSSLGRRASEAASGLRDRAKDASGSDHTRDAAGALPGPGVVGAGTGTTDTTTPAGGGSFGVGTAAETGPVSRSTYTGDTGGLDRDRS